MQNSSTKIMFYSLIIVLAAQLNMNLFIADFKISIACICFPILLFLSEEFTIIPITLCSAFGVFLSRLLFYWFQNGSLDAAVQSYFPEMLFYLVYGLLLYLYTLYLELHKNTLNKNSILIPLIFTDYLANLAELFFRLQLNAFTAKTQAGILLIALVRTAAIWCLLSIFKHYRLLLLNKEHEERYQRLLLLISKLNGEIVWMHKNTTLIESTMNTSYKLYEKLRAADTELAKSALHIANDIHEIKKEYFLIMRGISEALNEELESEGMYLNELLELLKVCAELHAKECKKTLSLKIDCPYNFFTTKHYALLSIFRNLLLNAVEAAKNSPVRITLSLLTQDEMYVFEATDDGPGIPPEEQTQVFEAGFSTKINYATGEINRGLGLNLVKDLVEAELNGALTLASAPGKTTFTIYLPKEKTEVKQL